MLNEFQVAGELELAEYLYTTETGADYGADYSNVEAVIDGGGLVNYPNPDNIDAAIADQVMNIDPNLGVLQ